VTPASAPSRPPVGLELNLPATPRQLLNEETTALSTHHLRGDTSSDESDDTDKIVESLRVGTDSRLYPTLPKGKLAADPASSIQHPNRLTPASLQFLYKQQRSHHLFLRLLLNKPRRPLHLLRQGYPN
jgi:hypothetical protein